MNRRREIINLAEMLDFTCAKYPKRIALIFETKKITYRQLSDSSMRLASALYNLGIREFDKVAIWLPNCPEFIYSFFAILRLKATVVPLNSMFKREEARLVVEDSGAKILICSIDKAENAQNLLSRLDSLKYVISLPAPKDNKAVFDFYSLLTGSEVFSPETTKQDEGIAEIVYTSGTTGRPKGACLTHENLIFNIKGCSETIKITKHDCFICILPLFHSFASTVCMLLPLYEGAKIVIIGKVMPFKPVIRAIFKHRVTIFAAVPSLYDILNEAKFPRLGLFLSLFLNPIRLCISGAAALPQNVWKKFEKKFKRPLLQGYGLTECSPVVSLHPLSKKKKPDSVGVPLSKVEVKVIDKEGGELPQGEVGELLVKGPNVMKGYYNLEEETKKVLKGGWLYTGDLAKIDSDGFIYIMGRLKEMIIVRGLNVYPREIEDILYRHPKIREAAVVGVSHRHRGEVPLAFVVSEGDLDEREILKHLRANLAPYKVPLKVFFKENLPKNPTGKILKRELQKEVEDIFK